VLRVVERVSWRSRTDPRRILVFDFDNLTGVDSLTPHVRAIADSIRGALRRQLSVEIVTDSSARATAGTEERRAVGTRFGAGAMVVGSLVRLRADSASFRVSVRDMSEERTFPQFDVRFPLASLVSSVQLLVERLLADLSQVNWGPKAQPG
jgi:hypothetical protein